MSVVHQDDEDKVPNDREPKVEDARSSLLVHNESARMNVSWMQPDLKHKHKIEVVNFTLLPDTPDNKQHRPYVAIFKMAFRNNARSMALKDNERCFRVRVGSSISHFDNIVDWSDRTPSFKVVAFARKKKRPRN
jgi:hypothetical protein